MFHTGNCDALKYRFVFESGFTVKFRVIKILLDIYD